MTKIYSTSALNSERDNKEAGTLHREWVKFREQNPERIREGISSEDVWTYHDEQMPVETRYKQRDVKFEYMPLKWVGATIPGPSKGCDAKYPAATTPFSVRARKKDGSLVTENRVYESTGEVEQQGKVWRSSKDFKITMLDRPAPLTIKDSVDEFDWMWRVFDNKHLLSDNGRKINLTWGEKWTTVFGSKPVRDIWQEEIRLGNYKFYSDSDAEILDLRNGNWRDVVEAHLGYFTDIATVILRKFRDSIPVDEVTAVTMYAITEFALKLSESNEDLKSRFRTAAYSVVHNYIREAIADKDVISSKSRQKIEDMRTLNDLIKSLKSELHRTPTIEAIMDKSGFGSRRLDSTFKIFDFNIGRNRDMNNEELLYTIMDLHLTERQAHIIEHSFGLGGIVKATLHDIAEDLGISYDTVQSDRKKAFKIIKNELSFKYENKSRL